MGSRNRAFHEDELDENSRNGVAEISKNTAIDGSQLSRIAKNLPGINFNEFATRKTIAQGMLDLALLTANAAQLKRIMTIGNSHKFYYFLMTLICISICLQVVQGVIMCILAIVFDLNKFDQHRRTNIANNILLMVTIVSVAINILISTFDIADFK